MPLPTAMSAVVFILVITVVLDRNHGVVTAEAGAQAREGGVCSCHENVDAADVCWEFIGANVRPDNWKCTQNGTGWQAEGGNGREHAEKPVVLLPMRLVRHPSREVQIAACRTFHIGKNIQTTLCSYPKLPLFSSVHEQQ